MFITDGDCKSKTKKEAVWHILILYQSNMHCWALYCWHVIYWQERPLKNPDLIVMLMKSVWDDLMYYHTGTSYQKMGKSPIIIFIQNDSQNGSQITLFGSHQYLHSSALTQQLGWMTRSGPEVLFCKHTKHWPHHYTTFASLYCWHTGSVHGFMPVVPNWSYHLCASPKIKAHKIRLFL